MQNSWSPGECMHSCSVDMPVSMCTPSGRLLRPRNPLPINGLNPAAFVTVGKGANKVDYVLIHAMMTI